MINVTVWYEYVEESGEIRPEFAPKGVSEDDLQHMSRYIADTAEKIRATYPRGLIGTLSEHLRQCGDMNVTYVNMFLPEYGLSDELLEHTDVLIWWAHIAHDSVPDALVAKIVERVQKGMGFIALHSAHLSKPFKWLLGTSGCLKWRESDYCRVWNMNPTHPIAAGLPEYFELPVEEVYCEPFDIAKPDDIIFTNWYRGGEVFRSGCTWTRGYGKIFYFQAGHETFPSYHDSNVLRIVENAVRWAAPTLWRTELSCPMIEEPPESKAR